MNVFAIIVTWNGGKWIKKCLESLQSGSISVSTIVIDNASIDNTVSLIKDQFPNVQLVESKRNLGFGQANNIGLEMAVQQDADYVLLLNQDAWIENTTLEKLINASLQYNEFGIVSPFHRNYDGSGIEKYFSEYVLSFYTPGYLQDLEFCCVKPIYSSSFIHAACWLLPINTVKKVGGFDPLFFHYGEDNDYIQRMSISNLKTGFVSNAILFHYGTNEGLANPGKSFKFRVNEIALNFKNPQASEIGAILLFFKHSIRSIYKCIDKSNSNKFRFEVKVFWFNFKRIPGIIRSRKIQKREFAFLNVNSK